MLAVVFLRHGTHLPFREPQLERGKRQTPPRTKGCATLVPFRAYRLAVEAGHLGVATRLPGALLAAPLLIVSYAIMVAAYHTGARGGRRCPRKMLSADGGHSRALPSLVGRGCLTIRDWDEGFDRRIAAWVVSARRTGDLVRLPFGSGQKSEARGIQRTPRAHLVCYSATLTDKQVTRCP